MSKKRRLINSDSGAKVQIRPERQKDKGAAS